MMHISKSEIWVVTRASTVNSAVSEFHNISHTIDIVYRNSFIITTYKIIH